MAKKKPLAAEEETKTSEAAEAPMRTAPAMEQMELLPNKVNEPDPEAPPIGKQGVRSGYQPNLIDELYTGETEDTFFRSPMVADSYKAPYNRDELWQRKGDYSVYEKMCNDDQVSVCLQLKKDLILGAGFNFIAEDDSQDDMVKDLTHIFTEQTEGDIESDMEEILTAHEFGFSLTEKIFKTLQDGKLGLRCLKTRHPNSWRMPQDDKGHVTDYLQITADGEKKIDRNSLIHYINKPKFQNPYGTSSLRAAYNAWFTKSQVMRYYGIFLEKAASPTPIGRYDKNAPKEAVDAIYEALKSLQTKTAMTIPKEVEVTLLEAKNTGEPYKKAVDLTNMFIARALFIPDLVGLSGGETAGGAYALGKEQMRLFFLHITKERRKLENLINLHIVKPIVYWNYGDVENYPKFRFKPIDAMEAVELAKVWLEAVKGKLYKPTEEEINYFRKLTQFPEGEIEFYNEQPVMVDENGNPMPPKPGGFPPKGGMPPKPDTDDNEDSPDGGEGADDKSGKDANSGAQLDSQKKGADKKDFAKVYNLPPGDYYKKCNFKALKTKLDDYDTSLWNDAQPIIKKAIDDLYEQIKKKNILGGTVASATNKMDGLKLKSSYMTELRKVLEGSFRALYKDSKSQAATELNKGAYSTPTTPQEFEDLISGEIYDYIADYEYKILGTTRTALRAAIKDGKPLSTIGTILDIEGNKLSETSIQRFARTKHTEIMNRARVDYFTESGVVAAYQYSAILDESTTDICAGLDGKIFEAGEQPVPPLHWNCRSTLIPITKYEEYKPTTSIQGQNPQDFIEDNKGKGFSTQ